MAINNIDTTRRYTKYKRHTNDSTERIDAKDVNQIQESINAHQEDTNIIKDTAFQERVYTIFENNLYANAMFIDVYSNGEYINKINSKNYILDPKLKNVCIDNNSESCTITSTKIHSVHGEQIEINDFFLITNQHIPIGASIKYYLKLVSGEMYPITPNVLKTPLHLTSNIKYGFSLVAEITKNALGESPVVNGYAVLYWDAQVEENYGLTNPDLQRFTETVVNDEENGDGITTIIRDRAQQDKVVEIQEPLDTVTLYYDKDNEGKLAFIKTEYYKPKMTQLTKLGYKDYLNSDDEVVNVVSTIEQRTITENNEQNEDYEKLDMELHFLINKNS